MAWLGVMKISDELEMAKESLRQLEMRRQAEATAYLSQIELLEKSNAQVTLQLEEQIRANASVLSELTSLRNTKLFRYSGWLRGIYGRLKPSRDTPGNPAGEAALVELPKTPSYDRWVAMYDSLTPERVEVIKRRLEKLKDQPLVSVLLAAFNSDPVLLRKAIESVVSQIYQRWELCIVDDGSTDPAVESVIKEYASADSRIKFVRRGENGHISAALNSAYSMSRGQWFCTLDHDDELAEHALAICVLALSCTPHAAVIYSDEDKIDLGGTRFEPFFKPDFDPVLLLGQNYPCHLTLLRRDLVDQIGGYREGFEGSQDWDLMIRACETVSPDQIVHVPFVLYHWRSHASSTSVAIATKSYAVDAGRHAVEEHLARKALRGRVVTNPVTGWQRVKWIVPDPAPKVSIVIPTRNGQYLPRCINSVMRFTTYQNFELVVIDNGSSSFATLDYLRTNDSILRVIRDERPFNYSALNNRAVAQCDGEIICLLNDDCEIISGDWLEELVCQVIQDGVGASGAKLLYPDGSIQHAGVILGIGGVAGHIHKLSDRLEPGDRGRLHLVQSLSAVTGACMVVRRQAWQEVGGFDEENLPVAFSDIDLCLRLGEAGWRVVWTPFAELIHHESVTRGSDEDEVNAQRFAKEFAFMKRRWGSMLRSDPAYSPNLTLVGEDCALAFPPRVSA